MASIQLRLRKTDDEFIGEAEKNLTDGYYLHKIVFKKIETMVKGDSIFVECPFSDLPEHIKNQIEKPEKSY